MRVRSLAMIASGVALVSCAAVLGLPDPTLDDTIPIGGGSSSGNASSSGSSGGDGSIDDGGTDGATTDGSVDAGPPLTCAAQTKWGNVQPLTTLNGNLQDLYPSLTADELTIYFARTIEFQPGAEVHIEVATRDAATEPFRAATQVQVDQPQSTAPCIASDGRRLFFSDQSATLIGSVWSAPRVDAGAFFPSTKQTGLSGGMRAFCRTVLPAANDGGTMYFHVETKPPPDTFGILRKAVFDPTMNSWDAGVADQPPSGDGGSVSSPVVRRDELEIFYTLAVGSFPAEIWTARRANRTDPWGPSTQVVELQQGSTSSISGWLSDDGCRMYFASTRTNNTLDLYVATRPPN